VSLAVYARGVNLYFIYGVALADKTRDDICFHNAARFLGLKG